MLLRFRVQNHKSLRDPAELSLMSERASGSKPPDGNWEAITTRVVGIYGANASGKSTVLDAIGFVVRAVAQSATRWGDKKRFPHEPFLLSKDSRESPSEYELDFVVDGVRYSYGFESDSTGVLAEWLHSFPFGKPRVLYERSRSEDDEFYFGRSLPGPNHVISKLVRPRSLFLSVAANNNHPTLSHIHASLLNGVMYAEFNESDRDMRIRWIRNIIEDDHALNLTIKLLQLADLGISKILLHSQEIDKNARAKIEKILSAFDEEITSGGKSDISDIIHDLQREIRFVHAADDDTDATLPIASESSGTVAWLSIGVPAIRCLEDGGTLMVDELDASLHPRLSSALISMFKDPEINRSGAQLIFSSHDVSLMGPLVGEQLSRDEIWFTEKSRDGATELYSLHEFNARKGDNFERRYLHGRYGAIPFVDPEQIRETLLGTTR